MGDKYRVIDEAQFHGEPHTTDHYFGHVLKPDEEINFRDPKFPHMDIEQFKKRAEALTLKKAHRPEKLNQLFLDKGKIYGWVAKNPKWKTHRFIKVDMTNQYMGGHEYVGYVDDKIDPSMDGEQIMTYMVVKPQNIIKFYLDEKVGDLPDSELVEEDRSDYNELDDNPYDDGQNAEDIPHDDNYFEEN